MGYSNFLPAKANCSLPAVTLTLQGWAGESEHPAQRINTHTSSSAGKTDKRFMGTPLFYSKQNTDHFRYLLFLLQI
jgi:hypothetical protein